LIIYNTKLACKPEGKTIFLFKLHLKAGGDKVLILKFIDKGVDFK